MEKDMGAIFNESWFFYQIPHNFPPLYQITKKNKEVAQPSSLIARLHATPLMNKYPNRYILNQKGARKSLPCELHNNVLI